MECEPQVHLRAGLNIHRLEIEEPPIADLDDRRAEQGVLVVLVGDRKQVLVRMVRVGVELPDTTIAPGVPGPQQPLIEDDVVLAGVERIDR